MMNGPGAMSDIKPLQMLSPEQKRASDPGADVWLSASAGTGKTQVLSARVLRLLLGGAKPESILCLTFTKAGAAEMAERVHSRLAAWVRAPDKLIMRDLYHLGELNDAAQVAKARALFATVLDARGGGLRIQTIHSFCQTLLSAFPGEAGLIPGFQPMDERATVQLAHNALADLVTEALRQGDEGFIRRFQDLALLKGEVGARAYLASCARAPRALAALGIGIEPKVRRALDLPLDDIEPIIMQFCTDGAFDRADLEAIRDLNLGWITKAGIGARRGAIVAGWLAATPAVRSSTLEALVLVWAKQDGALRSMGSSKAPQHTDYAEHCARAHAYFSALIERRKRALLAAQIASALHVGQRYAATYAEAKRKAGAVDFDDLIHITAQLLRTPGMGDWIRYKLDQMTDHILVDEAQDTNVAQWSIIQALADEFYAGEGAKQGVRRTIFTVGDTKQAIFGFQGTDPRAMETARQWFDAQARGADRELLDRNLHHSYRASPPLLTLVDAVIADLGPAALGPDARIVTHHAAAGVCGHITLLPPQRDDAATDSPPDTSEEGEGYNDTAISAADRKLAQMIAKHVRNAIDDVWIEDRAAKTTRPLRARDVMILLRSRGELARLIVAQLHALGVPVAGVDRLRLNTPLVVRDVIAALRFAVQPLDDLNLACLLTSPLLGWSQHALQHVGIAREKRALWPHLRATQTEMLLAPLYQLLRMGDRLSPARFIEALLSGPLKGRYRLIERFGSEARDPLDELMNAAISFERTEGTSLQAFLDWFERGDIDIKRDADASANAVRVLTVHGAKGLQAPLVILADAAANPDKKADRELNWLVDATMVPIPRPVKADRHGSIGSAADAARLRDLEEHYRLLYVALTRAEERLIIAGSIGKQKMVPPLSWHATVGRALSALGAAADDEGVFRYGKGAAPLAQSPLRAGDTQISAGQGDSQLPCPQWLDAAAPQEARPPRPLSPSALTQDNSANAPPSPMLLAAATRGRLLHALFERLPGVAKTHRTAAADRWLADAAGVADATERNSLIADALLVIDNPAFAAVFSADALAEAPIAGVVDGVVIAGTVDRLLVTEGSVTVLDFKTSRRVPVSADHIPEAHIRQMAAYVAVLQGIFPEHDVRAGLLYSSGPLLFVLDPLLLAAHKPSFALEQQVLADNA